MKFRATLAFPKGAYLFRQAVCLLCLISLAYGRPRHVVEKTVPDHFVPLPLDKQKLTGLLADRMRANTEGLLEVADVPALLELLQTPEGAKPNVEREYPGRFLDASASAYEYNQDLPLRSLMDRVATGLMAELSKTSHQTAKPMAAENYTIARCDMQGLVNYYRVTGEDSAFLAARTLADNTLSTLSPKQPATDGRSVVLARAGLLEPLMQIYRFSGEKRYLDFGKVIAAGTTLPAIADIKSPGELVATLYGLNGLVDLYQLTGESSYFQTGLRGWTDIAANNLTVTGAPVISGSASAPKADLSVGVDTCNTITWLQLTYKLLRITGDQVYGQAVERTLYNQVLAAQDLRTGSVSPTVPLNGVKTFSSKLTGENGRCILAEAKALSLIPLLVWGQYETGIAVNLYTPGRAFFQLGKHGLIRIYTEGNFPQTGLIQLHVEPSGKGQFQFPIRLRVPKWTSSFTVDVAGLHLVGRPGEPVIVDRAWRSGDTVRIRLSMDLHVAPATSADTNAEYLVLQRGPQVLTLSRKLNEELPKLGDASPTPTRSGQYQLFEYTGDLPQNWIGDQVYRISGEYASKKENLLLVPFADAVSYQTALRKRN